MRTFSPPRLACPGAPAYNPAARFDLAVSEVECRRNSAGRMLMAGIIKANPFLERFTVADLGTGRTAKCAFLVHSCQGTLVGDQLTSLPVVLTVLDNAVEIFCNDIGFA